MADGFARSSGAMAGGGSRPGGRALARRGCAGTGPARTFFVLGALSAMTGVAAGAFGAHALRALVAPDLLAVFETGARYQMYHAFALLAAAWAATRWPGRRAHAAGWLFAVGTLLFSGSLYLLVLTGVRGLGAVTPFGGLAFLAGWACLAAAPLARTADPTPPKETP
jgi:uncharacterized membrane protein YgdD (TMEM256/DUF423 family)